VRELNAAGIPFRMLGHGSNLVVSDAGIPDVVLHTRSMKNIYHHGEQEAALRCEAGATLARLVSVAHELSLAGAEGLIGIPGTIGGAVAGNAGGREVALGDLLTEVTLVEPDGTTRVVACSPADFGYRTSPFRGAVVLDAVVQLCPDTKPQIFERMTTTLRAKADSQPLSAWSAGCMFRNPENASSGALIDRAGCKGLSEGGAQVSPAHANFIVNTGGAEAEDVRRLVLKVQEAVRASAGVELPLEVEWWGAFEGGTPVPGEP
jgi:UDP-N-acetylmuramate dehydrogenase